MKALNPGSEQKRFDSELLEDLSFIKRRLRYPYQRAERRWQEAESWGRM